MVINFFSEECDFKLDNSTPIQSWLKQVAINNGQQLSDLNYIFCSDEYLLRMNQAHLNHDYYTDIITFDHSEESGEIEGDIFISIDRVEENAQLLEVSFHEELLRVMVHGLLHLLGFNDKNESEQKLMREKEDACISLLNN